MKFGASCSKHCFRVQVLTLWFLNTCQSRLPYLQHRIGNDNNGPLEYMRQSQNVDFFQALICCIFWYTGLVNDHASPSATENSKILAQNPFSFSNKLENLFFDLLKLQ